MYALTNYIYRKDSLRACGTTKLSLPFPAVETTDKTIKLRENKSPALNKLIYLIYRKSIELFSAGGLGGGLFAKVLSGTHARRLQYMYR